MTEGRLTRAGAKHDMVFFRDPEARFLRLVREQDVYVEVKSDQHCARGKHTGNVFIEYEQDPDGEGEWRPSGVYKTEADYWVEEFDHDCWLVVPVARVKYITEYWRTRGRAVCGGDYDRFHGVKVPIDSIVTPQRKGITLPRDDPRDAATVALDEALDAMFGLRAKP